MRGEIWTMRDDLYASKARPVVIVQSDKVSGFDSIVLCLMTDKIALVSRSMLGKRIGVLERDRIDEVSEKLALVLGLS